MFLIGHLCEAPLRCGVGYLGLLVVERLSLCSFL